jgi:hypothetical protein
VLHITASHGSKDVLLSTLKIPTPTRCRAATKYSKSWNKICLHVMNTKNTQTTVNLFFCTLYSCLSLTVATASTVGEHSYPMFKRVNYLRNQTHNKSNTCNWPYQNKPKQLLVVAEITPPMGTPWQEFPRYFRIYTWNFPRYFRIFKYLFHDLSRNRSAPQNTGRQTLLLPFTGYWLLHIMPGLHAYTS